MPLVPMTELLARARAGRYAVGYFESWDLASLQAVVDAAEETASPVIMGFSGDFLADPRRLAAERLPIYGAAGVVACEAARVPCSFIYNESPVLESVYDAMDCGFNVVMYSDHDVPRGELVDRVRDVALEAHPRGVSVEAEYDVLPFGAVDAEPPLSDPDEAAEFVRSTGVDALAVSVGNVHVLMSGKVVLDCGLVGRIAERVPAALVLHGGTGMDHASLREAIDAGISKVNYGSVLKQSFLDAVHGTLSRTRDLTNPHARLGDGSATDILVAGRSAVRAEVAALMEVLGCCGRA